VSPTPGIAPVFPAPGRPPGRGARLALGAADRSPAAADADADSGGTEESAISGKSDSAELTAAGTPGAGRAEGWVKGYASNVPTVMTRTPPVASATGPHRIVTLCF
jgi:hypothetical protein